MWALCQADTNSASNLATLGCFVLPNGKSVMTPPATGSFGDLGRNTFRDRGFKDVDFSVFKNFTFKERYSAQFRVEFFNLFNHPNYANPYGSVAGWVWAMTPEDNNQLSAAVAPRQMSWPATHSSAQAAPGRCNSG
jgi:hypothetical protein